MAMFDKMYTVDEVAQLAGVTTRTIRNYLKSNRLEGRKIGGQWRFTEQNVQDLLNGVVTENTDVQNETVQPVSLPAKEKNVEVSSHISPIQNIPSYQSIIKQPKTVSMQKANQTILPSSNVVISSNNDKNDEKNTNEAHMFDDFSSDSLFQEFADEAFDDRPNAVTYLSSLNKEDNAQTKAQTNSSVTSPTPTTLQPEKIIKEKNIQHPVSNQIPKTSVPNTSLSANTIPLANTSQPTVSQKNTTNEQNTKKQDAKTFASIAQEKLYPDSTPTSTDSINLTNIGKKVARFASEVHDCSKGNQICTIIDTFQTLTNAKKIIVQLADISRQESADGILCQVYTEYDERFSIARYTLFGTTSFVERCLSILNS